MKVLRPWLSAICAMVDDFVGRPGMRAEMLGWRASTCVYLSVAVGETLYHDVQHARTDSNCIHTPAGPITVCLSSMSIFLG